MRRRRHERSGAYLMPMALMHAHAPSMPSGRQWVIRGDVVRVGLRFHGPVAVRLSQWRSGWHRCSPSRGPFGALSFAATCFCLREWCVRAVWIDGSAGGRPRNRPERWSWRRMAAVLAQSAARLSMDRLERSLLVT